MADRVTLVVDDEPAIRTYLRNVLQSQGIHTVEAGTAIEGLRILHKLGGQIDLVIADIQMPGDMDGLDLAYSVLHSFPNLPVILISGYSDKGAGSFMLIRKPFTAGAILEAVNRAITPGSTTV